MKDFLNNDLNVGDQVAFMRINYRNLQRGVITAISKVKATIEFEGEYGRFYKNGKERTFQEGNQIIKINEREV